MTDAAEGPRPPDRADADPDLQAVTVGERVPLNGPIRLSEYDAEWPGRFEALAGRVRAALGDRVVRLEHVGSTSVPGLAAKPVIDLVLAVVDSADEAAYVPALEANGFRLRIREPAWFGHRLLEATDVAANLHVFSVGCEELDRMIAFRDWIREHDDDRCRYEATKRDLAGRFWQHVQHYADAKIDVVAEILSRALKSSG
jgi:GrpB-like predicted nucleotidyltransferase (UPF0157 family)